MKKMLFPVLAVPLFVLGSAATVNAQPTNLEIVTQNYTGESCAGAEAKIIGNWEKLEIDFAGLNAATRPGGPTRDTKACTARLRLRFDPKWSFSILRVEYRGYARLTADTAATLDSTWRFVTPVLEGSRANVDLRGPYGDNFLQMDDAPDAYSRCGVPVHDIDINNQVSVAGPEGQVTAHTETNKLKITYHLLWRPCM
jgi:hypothetical protein